MKYIKQFAIILSVSCLGELIKPFIPLPIPASIYGLILMMVLLAAKVIRLEQVEGAANYLIEVMPLMFIPAAVGLIAAMEELRAMLVPAILITLTSTITVMASAGKVTDFVLERKKK